MRCGFCVAYVSFPHTRDFVLCDRKVRSADAIAFSNTDLFVLSRQRFDEVTGGHKRLAIQLLRSIARVLAIRLRYANAKLRALREPGGS